MRVHEKQRNSFAEVQTLFQYSIMTSKEEVYSIEHSPTMNSTLTRGRRGTIALANTTVLALGQQILNGDERTRHESYGSLWRLVQSSQKLQVTVFDTLVKQKLLQKVIADFLSHDRGIRQASCKLLLHLVHRCHHNQKELTTHFSNWVIRTDIYCSVPQSEIENVIENNRMKGGYLCLLNCGVKLEEYKSKIGKMHDDQNQQKQFDDLTALGTAIVTAANSVNVEQYERGHAVTIPTSKWYAEPVDPSTHILAFVDYGGLPTSVKKSSMISHESMEKSQDNKKSPKRGHLIVEKHMHRWKDHVSRSLLAQLSVLHDVYRTAIVVERRQQQKSRSSSQTKQYPTGSVSTSIMGQVFRYACSEAGQSRNTEPSKKSIKASMKKINDKRTLDAGKNGNGLVPWMTRLVASEMGIRKIPAGLHGAVLFDNSLVSKYDTIFTAENGRIGSWDIFRRYWVHRWAADRLWQQLGINVCRTLLDSFDDAADNIVESSENNDSNELKVSWNEFHRLLATDVFLAGHPLRDLFLDSAKPEHEKENQISWGMYMHAVVFQLHELNRHHKERSSIVCAGDKQAAENRFSSGDSSGEDSDDFEKDNDHFKENGDVIEDSILGENGVVGAAARLSSPKCSSGKMYKPIIKNSSKKTDRLGRGSTRHALVHRLAEKQRYLRNLELELQQQDDTAAARQSSAFLSSSQKKGGYGNDEGKKERLRRHVDHLRRQVTQLNKKVGELTGGEHELVTVTSGISLVEEAAKIARLEDARSLHRQHLKARVAQNKINLSRELERKRIRVEKKAKTKFLKFQRPASASAGPFRCLPPKKKGGRGNGRRPMSAGVIRKTNTRMSNRKKFENDSSYLSMNTNTNIHTKISNTKKSRKKMMKRSTRAVNRRNEEEDALDARMHDFGMPGYGTSRAWKELKRFFAERVRINKKQAERERIRRQKLIWKRESEHMNRVTRRRNAKRRSSHLRLVKNQRKNIQAQMEKKTRIELEKVRQSEEFQRKHEEDMSWVKSAQFSPRARGVAYDSMRMLTMSPSSERRTSGGVMSRKSDKKLRQRPGTATGTYKRSGATLEGSNYSKNKRPTSANPRLRRNGKNSIPPRPPSAPIERARPEQDYISGVSSLRLQKEQTSSNITIPTRPSTAKPTFKAGPHAGRGAKHFHLVAELEDAKMLLEDIKAEQEINRCRIGSTLSGGKQTEKLTIKGEEENITIPGSENNLEEPATTSSNDEESIVNAAIIQAVQLQMLRQWPEKKMSLRVRQLVHGQLRGRAQQKAKNVELDHATQRLNDKSSTKKTLLQSSNLSTLPPRGHNPTKKHAVAVSAAAGEREPVGPFVRSTQQTGASPLIKFRRMTSQQNF
jgi:hypothetical protein